MVIGITLIEAVPSINNTRGVSPERTVLDASPVVPPPVVPDIPDIPCIPVVPTTIPPVVVVPVLIVAVIRYGGGGESQHHRYHHGRYRKNQLSASHSTDTPFLNDPRWITLALSISVDSG